MAEFAPADVPATRQQNQPARNTGNTVLNTKLNQTVVAVWNVNSVILRIATQHVTKGFFARAHTCRVFRNQSPTLAEETCATAI
ncbi:hypothetical protein D3C86_1813360 [compost metagenome]